MNRPISIKTLPNWKLEVIYEDGIKIARIKRLVNNLSSVLRLSSFALSDLALFAINSNTQTLVWNL